MAKCTFCNTRKGKRKCLAKDNTFVCSLCCGEKRNEGKCNGCSYYKSPHLNRKYSQVPNYALQVMADNTMIQDDADILESAVCKFDYENDQNINDGIVLRLIELLIDRYFFGDKELIFKNSLEENGFMFIDEIIKGEFKDQTSEEISKLLGTIYRSIKRHTTGNREYINFIHEHVGIRVAKGIRAIKGIS